jgi:hypothetical protein
MSGVREEVERLALPECRRTKIGRRHCPLLAGRDRWRFNRQGRTLAECLSSGEGPKTIFQKAPSSLATGVR